MTNDLDLYYRTKKIEKILSVVSMSGLAIGLIFLILTTIFNLHLSGTIYDTIAVIGISLVFMFPFLLMQFFISAGLYQKGLGWIWYLVFYLILFPFVNMWFFAGIDFLFDLLPNPRRLDLAMADMTLEEYRQTAGKYILFIYILLNGSGLLYRIGKDIFKKKQTLILSL